LGRGEGQEDSGEDQVGEGGDERQRKYGCAFVLPPAPGMKVLGFRRRWPLGPGAFLGERAFEPCGLEGAEIRLGDWPGDVSGPDLDRLTATRAGEPRSGTCVL